MTDMFLKLAIPNSSQMVCNWLLHTIGLYFIGKLDNAAMTAGFGLAILLVGVLGLSFLIGTNCAQETLASQAYGAGELRLCGILLNRGRLILVALFVPIAFIFYNSESIFLLIGQDPEVAYYASSYAKAQMVGTFFLGQFDLSKRFLI